MKAPRPQIPLWPNDSPAALTDFLDDFAGAARLTASERYVHGLMTVVKRFIWETSTFVAGDVTVGSVERYLAGVAARGRSLKTIYGHRSALNLFFGFLCSRGVLTFNPAPQVRLGRRELQLPRYLDDGEVAQVLTLAREYEIWPEVAFALATGLRLGELTRLRWRDVDTARRCVTVLKSKSGRPRVVPLAQGALDAIAVQAQKTGGFDYVFPARRTWRGGWSYVNKPRAYGSWRRALLPIQRAVPKFRTVRGTGRGWHLLRHTFASRLVQEGVSLYKVARWMGHADVRTTQIYAHLQTEFDEDIESIALPARAD
jgi:site-specific recombinase XerD